MPVRAGSLDELRQEGRLLTKVGSLPVVVFWHDDRAWAIEDRCPHMGFPLRQGTVEAGLVTCHWHHARFDLATGLHPRPLRRRRRGLRRHRRRRRRVRGARAPRRDPVGYLWRRLDDGLEDGDHAGASRSRCSACSRPGVPDAEIVRRGRRVRDALPRPRLGCGPHRAHRDGQPAPRRSTDGRPCACARARACVRGPRHAQQPRRASRRPFDGDGDDVDPARLAGWYRRFVDTRSGDAAERVLATALADRCADRRRSSARCSAPSPTTSSSTAATPSTSPTRRSRRSTTSVPKPRPQVLPTLVQQTASASWSEQSGTWRHPHDLAALVAATNARLARRDRGRGTRRRASRTSPGSAGSCSRTIPFAVVDALLDRDRRRRDGRAARSRGRVRGRVADHALPRAERLRRLGHRAPRVHRGERVAPGAGAQPVARAATAGSCTARCASTSTGSSTCPRPGMPDARERRPRRARRVLGDPGRRRPTPARSPPGYLRGGGDPARLIATLGHALLREDAEFHWYQVFEAGVRQFHAWPRAPRRASSSSPALARFLAAHTPTRRELSRVVDIAARLRRGEELYEES